MIIHTNEQGEALYQLNPDLIMKVSFREVHNPEGMFYEARLTMSDGSYIHIPRATFEGIREQLPWFDEGAKMAANVVEGVWPVAEENEYGPDTLPRSAGIAARTVHPPGRFAGI